MGGVLSGRVAKGIDPPPPWSTFAARYNSASEIGSGQSLLDAQVLLVEHRALAESRIDQLANQGIARVSDSERETYLLGFGELLSHTPDEQACAALAESRTPELVRTRTLVGMPDSHVRLWMAARQSAALAELRKRPITVSDSEASPELKQALVAVLGERAAADLERYLTARTPLTGKEICELGVAGGVAVYRLDEPYRAQFAAILANHFVAQASGGGLPHAQNQQ